MPVFYLKTIILDFKILNITFTAKNFKPHTSIFTPSSRVNPDIPCSDHIGKHTCRMRISIRVADKDLIEREMNKHENELPLAHHTHLI